MRTFKEFKEYLEEKGRCWSGYKPVPGKKAFSKGSCVKEEEVELEEAKHYPYKFRATYHDPDTNEVTHYMDFTHRNLDAAKKHAQGNRLERKDGKQDKLHSVVQMKEEVEKLVETRLASFHAQDQSKNHYHFNVGKNNGKLYHEVHGERSALHPANIFPRGHGGDNVPVSHARAVGNLVAAGKHKEALAHLNKHSYYKWTAEDIDEEVEEYDVEELFDILEEVVNGIAEESNIDPEILWENLEDVSDEELYETAAWRRKEGKNPTGGLNAKGIASYRRENPGSTLKKAVTGKVKPGSKAAKRRKSFCARMGGMPGAMKKPNGEPTRKALALRKWKCR